MERLAVLTLNVWNRQGPWDRRLALIRAGLESLGPDVVGLQEVLAFEGAGDQASEIAAGLGYHVRYAAVWEIGGGLTMGNAVLSRFSFVATEALELPAGPGQRPDGAVFAAVDAPCGQVPVFCAHLAWKLHHTDVRCRQVQALVEHVRRLAPLGGFPPVLLGDFNADPDADEMRYLRGLTALGGRGAYFADCWLACNQERPWAGVTYDRRNPYALRSREPSRRIDYVYVRGPDRQLRGEPLAARVVFDRPEDGVFASDHYGVYAEVQAAPRSLDPF